MTCELSQYSVKIKEEERSKSAQQPLNSITLPLVWERTALVADAASHTYSQPHPTELASVCTPSSCTQ